jgi:hypothetical protein
LTTFNPAYLFITPLISDRYRPSFAGHFGFRGHHRPATRQATKHGEVDAGVWRLRGQRHRGPEPRVPGLRRRRVRACAWRGQVHVCGGLQEPQVGDHFDQGKRQ